MSVDVARRETQRWDLGQIEKNRLGMIFFLIGEAVFFSLLILSYVYFRRIWVDGQHGPTARVLDIPLTGLFTIALLSSSLTIWLSERSLKQGNHRGMRRWLFATIVLGAIFLAGQANEYAKLFGEGITMRSGLFGSTFFTLTGFHGFHVFVGLVMLSILLGLAVAGDFEGGTHSRAFDALSLYWHFVDLVWVAVFSTVYIWTLLS